MPFTWHTRTHESPSMPSLSPPASSPTPSAPLISSLISYPILGYLDDLILVPLGIYLVLKLIPDEVMTECRAKARALSSQKRPTNLLAAIVIVAIWLTLAALSLYFIIRVMRD